MMIFGSSGNPAEKTLGSAAGNQAKKSEGRRASRQSDLGKQTINGNSPNQDEYKKEKPPEDTAPHCHTDPGVLRARRVFLRALTPLPRLLDP